MTINIKKLDKSDRRYGRGIDNVYYPANYGIIVNSKHKGYITCRGVRYMESAEWCVSYITKEGNVRELTSFFGKSKPFTKAKEWVMKNFEKKVDKL